MTYTKALKTVVFTLHDESTVTAADTATAQIGSNAFAQFMDKNQPIIVVPGADDTTYIPFHAVVKAVVSVADSDSITKNDPICGAE